MKWKRTDFRINEKRNIHKSILEKIDSKKEFKIKKIHFLLLRNSNEDFESTYINPRCRKLENKIWAKYIGKDYNLDNIVAYHWSEKKKEGHIDSFNTYIKMIYHQSNFKIIGTYLIVIGGLSIIFNFSSSYIWKKYIVDFLFK
jgi:hypothetical protein